MNYPDRGPRQDDSFWLSVGTLIVAYVGSVCSLTLLLLAARWFYLALVS